METKNYTVLRVTATLTGLALIAAETNINLTHVVDKAQPLLDQPLVVAVAVAGVAQAVAIMVLVAAAKSRRFLLSLVTLLGLAAAVAFTFSTTYERTAGARAQRAQTADLANGAQRVARSKVASAEARVAAECVTRGPECRRREIELADARATLAAQPAEIEARALGRLDIVPELALPLMLLLLGFAFIAFAEKPSSPALRLASSARDDAIQSDYPALRHDEASNVLAFFRPSDGDEKDGGATVKPKKPAPGPAGEGRKQEVLAALVTDLALGRRFGSQRELSERFGVARSTLSDWLHEWEEAGALPVRRTVGRCKALASA